MGYIKLIAFIVAVAISIRTAFMIMDYLRIWFVKNYMMKKTEEKTDTDVKEAEAKEVEITAEVKDAEEDENN